MANGKEGEGELTPQKVQLLGLPEHSDIVNCIYVVSDEGREV